MSGSTPPRTAPARRLGPEDWAGAALAALADGGVAAVAVERVAARLGATKGSFYWHFVNRDALLRAALELWERAGTDDVIVRLDALADPAEALRQLFAVTFADEASGHVDAALLAERGEPQVAPALARVTAKRLAWLSSTLEQTGSTASQARQHALVIYASWTGVAVLRGALPSLVQGAGDADELLRHFLTVLDIAEPDGVP